MNVELTSSVPTYKGSEGAWNRSMDMEAEPEPAAESMML